MEDKGFRRQGIRTDFPSEQIFDSARRRIRLAQVRRYSAKESGRLIDDGAPYWKMPPGSHPGNAELRLEGSNSGD